MKHIIFYIILMSNIVSIYCLDLIQRQAIRRSGWNGFHYNNNSVVQYNIAMMILRSITLQGNERVLDISNNERIGAEIAKQVSQGSVHVLHRSSDMVDFARITYSPLKNLSFELADLISCDLDNSSYDLVTSFGSVDWIEDKKAALIKIAQACKKGAKICIGVLDKDSDYLRVRKEIITHEKWKDFFHEYKMSFFPTDEDEMRYCIIQAGLNIISLQQELLQYSFSTRNSFRDWLISIPLQYDQIPLDRREEFLDDIIDRYLKVTGQKEDGSIILSLKTLLIVADK